MPPGLSVRPSSGEAVLLFELFAWASQESCPAVLPDTENAVGQVQPTRGLLHDQVIVNPLHVRNTGSVLAGRVLLRLGVDETAQLNIALDGFDTDGE